MNDRAFDFPENTPKTNRSKFILVILLTVLVLFLLHSIVGPPLIFAFPVIGILVLIIMRPQLSRSEVYYALTLAVVAGIAGLGSAWVTIQLPIWATLQFALVLFGLLAGWSILNQTGLSRAGIGRNILITQRAGAALRSFFQGLLIAMPWALGMIALGSANEENWVSSWWQPLVAIQPGIAEEAWGRVLLVPLLFLLFRRFAKDHTALTCAVVVIAYWFAYLHTSGGVDGIFSAIMIGTLFSLPVSYLWLRRGLETAIGFHFWLDFIKFAAALLLNEGFLTG
ncbi:MAG: CPBP family intramembrane metalloprotease [Gammaproteobacteria bacterium]|nr:CPBP family intramembrane metalloprotease [Gammaproteobacteria bacterium]